MSSDNKESLDNAMQTLNQLVSSHSTPKNFKKTINDLMIDLKSEEYSVSVRAANAISSLDDITQNPDIPSFVRTSLWQVVSVLVSIRE